MKVALIMIANFSVLVAGRWGCRQCIGYQGIVFTEYVAEAQAIDFFFGSLGNCGTGDDYAITNKIADQCEDQESENKLCKSWVFELDFWRYCGNGGLVAVNKGSHCINGICSSRDFRNMKCSMSVNCRGNCDSAQC